MDKSCSTCPSFVPQNEVEAEFRGNVGGGYCMRFGHILGKPGLPEDAVDALHREFASSCDSYGEPKPVRTRGVNDFPRAVVCTADMTLVVAKADPAFVPERLGSCRSCANLVSDDAVRDEFGWALPLCAAQGRLIFPHRLVIEPKTCGMAKAGSARDVTDGLFLDPRYNDAFNFSTVGVSVSAGDENDAGINADDENVSDPREYETDKPVSERHQAEGIRAWRKITSPYDQRVFTYMPIFDPEFFTENERKLIPQLGDASHPELYVDHQHLEYRIAVIIMELEKSPSMTGHAGVGKTELWNYLAWRCQLPLRIFSITDKSEIEDLKGKWLFREGETRFLKGRLSIGWTGPGFVLVDEPRVGPEDIWEMMRPMTDARQYIPLDEAEGEVLHKHNWCFFGLADNFSWDPRYVGVHEISEADRDRLYHVLVGLPSDTLERKILLRRMRNIYGWEPSVEVMDKVMAIAGTLRTMGDNKDLSITWGMRPQFKVLELMKWVPVEEAYRMAMLNDLEPETIKQVLNVVRDHF